MVDRALYRYSWSQNFKQGWNQKFLVGGEGKKKKLQNLVIKFAWTFTKFHSNGIVAYCQVECVQKVVKKIY